MAASVLINPTILAHVPRPHPEPATAQSSVTLARRCHALVLIFIGTTTLLRLLYLVLWCPYDLAPDEAHYWDWSRHLDWSYYSKGPLIAWLIRASCEIFGPLSESLHGTLMPAVRLPAVCCGALLVLGLYVLTYRSTRSPVLALAVASLALILPALVVASLIMTIDAPFLCCWCWALVVGREALLEKKHWAWPVLGVLIAVGILAKYTMLLWLVSAGLFLLFTPSQRHLLARPGFWVTVSLSSLSALPILWWNSQHEWVTFRHVAGQAGVVSTGFRWFGPFAYLGEQAGALLVIWFVMWVYGVIRLRPWGKTSLAARYLWWLSVPTFALFGLTSFRSAVQMNWPATAYLSGFVLASMAYREAGPRWPPAIRSGRRPSRPAG